MKPINDRVVVIPQKAEERTKGGIILPNAIQDQVTKGTVVSVGIGFKDETMQVVKDDVVLFVKGKGVEIEENNTKYLVLRQDDILVILNK